MLLSNDGFLAWYIYILILLYVKGDYLFNEESSLEQSFVTR